MVFNECGIDYIYDSLLEVNGEWIRPDFLLLKLDNVIIEFKGMNEPEYNEKFMRKLEILRNAGMQVMVLREEDVWRIREIIT
jgi:predicted nuclease of restriction endonuclease-like RecB superfamily